MSDLKKDIVERLNELHPDTVASPTFKKFQRQAVLAWPQLSARLKAAEAIVAALIQKPLSNRIHSDVIDLTIAALRRLL